MGCRHSRPEFQPSSASQPERSKGAIDRYAVHPAQNAPANAKPTLSLDGAQPTVIDASRITSEEDWQWISPSQFFCCLQALRDPGRKNSGLFCVDACSPGLNEPPESITLRKEASRLLGICPCWAIPLHRLVPSHDNHPHHFAPEASPTCSRRLKTLLDFRTVVIFDTWEAKTKASIQPAVQTMLNTLKSCGVMPKAIFILEGGLQRFLKQNLESGKRYTGWGPIPCPTGQHASTANTAPVRFMSQASTARFPYSDSVYEIVPPSVDHNTGRLTPWQTFSKHNFSDFSLLIGARRTFAFSAREPPQLDATCMTKIRYVLGISTRLDPRTLPQRACTVGVPPAKHIHDTDTIAHTNTPCTWYTPQSASGYYRQLESLYHEHAQDSDFEAFVADFWKADSGVFLCTCLETCQKCVDLVHKALEEEEKGGVLLVDEADVLLAAVVAIWFLMECGNSLSASRELVQLKLVRGVNISAGLGNFLVELEAALQATPSSRNEARLMVLDRIFQKARFDVLAHLQSHTEIDNTNAEKPPKDAIAHDFGTMQQELSSAALKEALRVIERSLANVVRCPEDPKYRVIRRSNAKFHSSVGSHPAALHFFLSSGWTEDFEKGVLTFNNDEKALETASRVLKLINALQRAT